MADESIDRARAAVDKVGIDTSELGDVLAQTHTDSYVAGTHVALGALPDGVDAVAPSWEADLDWSRWAPGNAPAADAIRAENLDALARMLDDTDATLEGIGSFTREALARTLAEGMDAGEPARDLTARVAAALDDDSRAEVIARTETMRAANVAALDTYKTNGMGGRQWLAAADAEEDCADLDGVIVAIDEDFDDGDPPLHPNCRCTTVPVLTSEMDNGDEG